MNTYIYTYIHTRADVSLALGNVTSYESEAYIHTYIHAYIHTYIHTYLSRRCVSISRKCHFV